MKINVEIDLLDNSTDGRVSIKAFDGKVQIVSHKLTTTMKIAVVAMGREIDRALAAEIAPAKALPTPVADPTRPINFTPAFWSAVENLVDRRFEERRTGSSDPFKLMAQEDKQRDSETSVTPAVNELLGKHVVATVLYTDGEEPKLTTLSELSEADRQLAINAVRDKFVADNRRDKDAS